MTKIIFEKDPDTVSITELKPGEFYTIPENRTCLCMLLKVVPATKEVGYHLQSICWTRDGMQILQARRDLEVIVRSVDLMVRES